MDKYLKIYKKLRTCPHSNVGWVFEQILSRRQNFAVLYQFFFNLTDNKLKKNYFQSNIWNPIFSISLIWFSNSIKKYVNIKKTQPLTNPLIWRSGFFCFFGISICVIHSHSPSVINQFRWTEHFIRCVNSRNDFRLVRQLHTRHYIASYRRIIF